MKTPKPEAGIGHMDNSKATITATTGTGGQAPDVSKQIDSKSDINAEDKSQGNGAASGS